MNRLAAVLLISLAAVACTDDRVTLARGPLGPARYRVEVSATGEVTEISEHREAALDVEPLSGGGAAFMLRTSADEVIQAELKRLEDGSLVLERVRGASVGSSGEADLGSLVGQLDPPLPSEPVRLGDSWSSTQRITTDTLSASVRTKLRIVRYRRIAGTDAAELEGDVSGRLETSGSSGTFSGSLRGQTRIAWSVRSGRVVAAETRLVWTLTDGGRVTLETSVQSA